MSGDRVSIGATTTLAGVEDDERLAVLHPCIRSIAARPVRTLATVAGNLFVRQPYGDLAVNAEDPNELLALHRALIALRREFAEAGYRTLHAGDGVLAYARGDRHAVALNLTGEPRPLPVGGEVLLSTHLDGGGRALRADEGVVLRI